MKTILRLLFGRPSKPKRAKAPKKKKRSLSSVLLDRLLSIPLSALELKWNESLWKADF